MVERSLIVFKPDAVQRGLVGEILARFEKAGLKVVGMKMVSPDYEHYYHHYENIGKMISRRGQAAFDVTLELMQQGPVIATVIEGVHAVEFVRKMAGATEPWSALPGTIRGDYAHVSYEYANTEITPIANLLHASGDVDEAELEIAFWFRPEELFEYETLSEAFTRKQRKAKK